MNTRLKLNMQKQPTYTTCGPTTLHAIYNYYGDSISLEQTISEIRQFEEGGGTIAVSLANHALKRGYDVCLYSYNLNIFDPTWFELDKEQMIIKLEQRLAQKELSAKAKRIYPQYIKYLKLGGTILFRDLSKELIFNHLKFEEPIITSLNCTWLYKDMREDSVTNIENDIIGNSVGHFVVLHGMKDNKVNVADPFEQNPIGETLYYDIEFDRLINSILLGITSFDGNLLVIRKEK
ncbi:MAG: hypothetical protein CME62_00395 [Halobacteriovoraceae bacterium]|nr:hypothetical protein [Halobacteriovoraceae bacterium]